MRVLDDKTMIPVGIALIVFGSSAAWITRISIAHDSVELRVIKNEQRIEMYADYFQEIRERLIRIEMELKRARK